LLELILGLKFNLCKIIRLLFFGAAYNLEQKKLFEVLNQTTGLTKLATKYIERWLNEKILSLLQYCWKYF
jgi:hypothetical protein